MRNELYYFLASETQNYTDVDAYISDLALSSAWEDAEDAEIPAERIEFLRNLYTAAHRGVKDIATLAGMSVRQLAFRFAIPQRTIENWSADITSAPVYTLLMMQECLGLFAAEGLK